MKRATNSRDWQNHRQAQTRQLGLREIAQEAYDEIDATYPIIGSDKIPTCQAKALAKGIVDKFVHGYVAAELENQVAVLTRQLNEQQRQR